MAYYTETDTPDYTYTKTELPSETKQSSAVLDI